jgi:3-oxoacyl-[acyl-carrier protein] reductase
MDLGLAGRKAIVCASSQGLGLACAESLAREGAVVFINGRHLDKLQGVAADLAQKTGARVVPVCADITTDEGRQALLAACPEPDILVNNNAGPPPGKMAEWTPEVWNKALQANMMSHIFLIQAVIEGMRQRRFGRIISITSAMVKTPRPHMALSTASRTGLTAFAKALSLDAARDNVTLNQLLPERIDSPRQVAMTERRMGQEKRTWDEARARITDNVAARRFGTLREFGDACAYLCSAQVSFISGQNLQLDGGSYPGLL